MDNFEKSYTSLLVLLVMLLVIVVVHLLVPRRLRGSLPLLVTIAALELAICGVAVIIGVSASNKQSLLPGNEFAGLGAAYAAGLFAINFVLIGVLTGHRVFNREKDLPPEPRTQPGDSPPAP